MEKMKEIDARGLSCPQPVILTNKAIQHAVFPFYILVDTMTSCQNVTRTAGKAGLKTKIEEKKDEYKIIIDK